MPPVARQPDLMGQRSIPGSKEPSQSQRNSEISEPRDGETSGDETSKEESVLASAFFDSDSEESEAESAGQPLSPTVGATRGAFTSDEDEDEPLLHRIERKRQESMSLSPLNNRKRNLSSAPSPRPEKHQKMEPSVTHVKRVASTAHPRARSDAPPPVSSPEEEELKEQARKKAKLQLSKHSLVGMLNDLDDSQDASAGVALSPLPKKLAKKQAAVSSKIAPVPTATGKTLAPAVKGSLPPPARPLSAQSGLSGGLPKRPERPLKPSSGTTTTTTAAAPTVQQQINKQRPSAALPFSKVEKSSNKMDRPVSSKQMKDTSKAAPVPSGAAGAALKTKLHHREDISKISNKSTKLISKTKPSQGHISKRLALGGASTSRAQLSHSVRPGTTTAGHIPPRPHTSGLTRTFSNSNKFWCLDNVPEWVTDHALQNALVDLFKKEFKKDEVSGLVGVYIPIVHLDVGRSHPGYALITFTSPAAAEKAEPVLRQLCVHSRACDVPRPLILHRPWLKRDFPWGRNQQLPGHLPIDQSVTPHFVQPNSIEFEMAMDWRVLEKAAGIAREELHAQHAKEIAMTLQNYLKESGKHASSLSETALRKPPPRPATLPSACLWLRGVTPSLTADAIKEAFAQFGYPQKVDILRDKVTMQFTGNAIMWMESPERASLVAENMKEMIFVLGGSPRSLAVEAAHVGGPQGSQSTYDRALCAVFGQYDDGISAGHAVDAEVEFVKIPEEPSMDAPIEHHVAAFLRAMLENHRIEQDEARKVVREARGKLAEEQIKVYKIESDKLLRLQNLTGNPVFEKMCALHGLHYRQYGHRGAAPLRQS